MTLKATPIAECIEAIQNGKIILSIDDANDENPSSHIIAAGHFANKQLLETMNQISQSDNIVSISTEVSKQLRLDRDFNHKPIQAPYLELNSESSTSPITLSKDIHRLNNTKRPENAIKLVEARHMGVLKRAGHAEAAIDCSRLAGFQEIGIISPCQTKEGTALQTLEIKKLVESHHLPVLSIKELIHYRNLSEHYVKLIKKESITTQFGDFIKHTYEDTLNHKYHYALCLGEKFSKNEAVNVRVHSECLTGDLFGSLRCDCGPQLDAAMKYIQEQKQGIILYMRQEGRGIGLNNKVKAYKLQETGLDTVEANTMLGFKADLRDYGVGAQILQDLDVQQLNLLTNNPRKIVGLEGYNLEIKKRIPIHINPSDFNSNYLSTKKDKLGHLIN